MNEQDFNQQDFSRPLRVAVLMGGDSAEREISLASGICVADALERAGHRPRAIDPAEIDLVDVDWRQFDVCFIALHGGAGEDGRVQALLDSLGVPYTGSDPAASALAMSKSAAKHRWLELGLPTAPFVLFHAVEPIGEITRRARSLGYPVVVKPDGEGSSLGVSIARTEAELHCAVAESQFYDPCTLAEMVIPGREFTVSLIGGRPLPPVEILTGGRLFSFDAKYHKNESANEASFRFEAELTPKLRQTLEQTAVEAAEALGAEGLTRVDLIVSELGQPHILELNTVPGMTEHSLAPLAAARAGIDMPSLCSLLIRDCLALEVAR